jgi:hypothetical protein
MEVLFSIFTIFITYITLYSYGSVLSKKIFDQSNIDIFFRILIGYIFIGIISLIIHFFFELNNIFSIIIIIVGLIIFFLDKSLISKENFFIPLLIILCSSFFLFAYSDHPIDTNMYHHPYVSYLKSEKIIFAVANIQFRFGHISFLQYVQAALTNDYLHNISLGIINIIFYISFLIIASNKIFKSKKFDFNFLIIILFSSFLLIKFARYREYGNDLIPLLVSIYFFINIVDIQSKFSLSRDNLINLFLPFVAIMFMHKLSYVVTLLIFSPIFINIKAKSINKIQTSSLVIFLMLISPWLIKNLITTSCFAYPIVSSCFSNSIIVLYGVATPESASWLTEIWSKGFLDHPNWQNINLKDYASGFNWVPTWASGHFLKILEIVSPLFLVIVIFSLYIFLKKDEYLKRKTVFHFNVTYIYLWFSLVFGLLLWFYKAPVFRFGSFYIISIIIFSYILLLNFFFYPKESFKINFFKIIFIICIIFFFSKNILRINNSNNSFFPKTFNYENLEELSLNNFEELKMLRPIQSGLCYYTKSICSHEIPKNIKIKKLDNYYVITK